MRPWVVPVMHHVRVGWIFTQRERERARGRKREGEREMEKERKGALTKSVISR